MPTRAAAAFAALAFSALFAFAAAPATAAEAGASCTPPTTVTRFPIEGAIGVKWSAKAGLLAFGKMAEHDRFDVWLSDRDGRNPRRLTSPKWNDAKHQFPIAWHPSGEYLVVLVEKWDHKGNGWDATPGYGAHSDYWLVRPDGSDATLMVETPGDDDHAITHADFSPNGRKFVWTERIKSPSWFSLSLMAGTYRFNLADVVIDKGAMPRLANVRHIVPKGKPQGGEVESFGADNRTIYFYSTMDSGNLFATPLYSMDTESGEIRQLTSESFAQTPTPTADGKRLIYMTAVSSDVKPAKVDGADWWIMDLDGGRKQRLTTLSVQGSSQSPGGRNLTGSIAVLDEHSFYGDVLTQVFGLVGYIVKVEIKPGCVK